MELRAYSKDRQSLHRTILETFLIFFFPLKAVNRIRTKILVTSISLGQDCHNKLGFESGM